MKPCDRNIKSTIQLIKEMIKLADKGDIEREDTGCGILYGILRDCAYKLNKLAEIEKENHIKKGWWKGENSNGRSKGNSNRKKHFDCICR